MVVVRQRPVLAAREKGWAVAAQQEHHVQRIFRKGKGQIRAAAAAAAAAGAAAASAGMHQRLTPGLLAGKVGA